ncbi:hypothetical protein FA95DRAFT_1552536 [Auriscalpium vulgare]|uniref:Uncharacterized protein n=1 Tax=Auriscalpium vulgare TaxID=40419 RepID=A0ACB8SAP0_9AGAM|nr:hypothetical protein FA95DRAFT_1552536 [Auriscalpium vulgare]
MQPPSPDIVSIESLFVQTTFGADAKTAPQPLYISIHFHLHPTSLLLAAATDDSRFSIRYWDFVEQVQERVKAGAPWPSTRALGRVVTGLAFSHVGEAAKEVKVVVRAPKAAPRASGGIGFELVTPQGAQAQDVTAFVQALELGVTLGTEAPERARRQRVKFDMWFVENQHLAPEVDYGAIVDKVVEEVEASSHRTLERLVHEATRVATTAGREHLTEVTVRAERPAAVATASALVVQLTRPCNQ